MAVLNSPDSLMRLDVPKRMPTLFSRDELNLFVRYLHIGR